MKYDIRLYAKENQDGLNIRGIVLIRNTGTVSYSITGAQDYVCEYVEISMIYKQEPTLSLTYLNYEQFENWVNSVRNIDRYQFVHYYTAGFQELAESLIEQIDKFLLWNRLGK